MKFSPSSSWVVSTSEKALHSTFLEKWLWDNPSFGPHTCTHMYIHTCTCTQWNKTVPLPRNQKKKKILIPMPRSKIHLIKNPTVHPFRFLWATKILLLIPSGHCIISPRATIRSMSPGDFYFCGPTRPWRKALNTKVIYESWPNLQVCQAPTQNAWRSCE